jgi:hypothetical protein
MKLYIVTEYKHSVHSCNDASLRDRIAWKEKIKFDLVRPTTVIHRLGSRRIRTWAVGGVQEFEARDFEAYNRVMPHSEYVSGSACLFESQKDLVNGYLTAIGLDPTSFPIAFPTMGVGSSTVEPGVVPAQPITLEYPNVNIMAEVGGISRLNGGMHFDASVSGAQKLCSGIGHHAVVGSAALYQ